jgi:hypothetical protein
MRPVWIFLAACGLATSLAAAQDRHFSKVQSKIAKVAGNAHILQGAGGLLEPSKRYSGDFVNQDTFLETLYNPLTGQRIGKLIKHN